MWWKNYKNINSDDSSSGFWSPKINDVPNLTNDRRFESVFEQSNTLLSDGIIWFKTRAIIDDISEDYHIIIKNGTNYNPSIFRKTFWCNYSNLSCFIFNISEVLGIDKISGISLIVLAIRLLESLYAIFGRLNFY